MDRFTDEQVRLRCGLGLGDGCCSFLLLGCAAGLGWSCAKGTEHEAPLHARRRAGTMNAMGDRCSGPPDFLEPAWPPP